MAAFNSAGGFADSPVAREQSIPADADRAGGSNILVQPSPRGGASPLAHLPPHMGQQWAQESPRGVRAMVAAGGPPVKPSHALDHAQPGSARGHYTSGGRCSATPRAETPPLAIPPGSARGPPRPSGAAKLWVHGSGQEAVGTQRASTAVRAGPRRSTDGTSVISGPSTGLSTGASSSRPSVRGRFARAVASPLGPALC
eukprot:1184120-Amphidinium_carterae.1